MSENEKMKRNKKIIVASIAVLLLVAIPLFLILFTKSNSNVIDNIQYKKLSLPPTTEEKELDKNILTTADIFPLNYTPIIEKNNLALSQKNRIELLRYGKTIIEANKEEDFNRSIKQLLQTNTPVLLNDQILSIYFQNSLNQIEKEIIENDLSKNLLEILRRNKLKIEIRRVLSFSNSNKLKTSLTSCIRHLENNKYKECVNELASLNGKEKEILSLAIGKDIQVLDGLNVILGMKSILSEIEEQDLRKQIWDSNTITENDKVVLDNLNIENSNREDISTESIIYADINKQLVERMEETAKYIQDSVREANLECEEIKGLRKSLTNLREYISKQEKDEARDTEDILDILFSINYNSTKKRYLLQVIKVKDVDTLFVIPFVEEVESLTEIVDENFSESYDIPPLAQSAGSVRLPTLMYHHIATTDSTNKFVQGLFVSPEMFEEQIAYLTKKNYKSINVEEFNTVFSSGKNPKQKSVMITFDDSTLSHYTQAYPILKKYGHTGVFFVISNRSQISHTQLKEMSDNGMDIQSHSRTHPMFRKTDSESLVSEIAGSKADLERITGKKVTSIAYPGCEADQRGFEIVRSSGYKTGFSCGRYIDYRENNRYYLSRVHVFNDMESFVKMLSVGL